MLFKKKKKTHYSYIYNKECYICSNKLTIKSSPNYYEKNGFCYNSFATANFL